MPDEPEESGLRGSVRRAMGGAIEATVGRVGEVALEVTGTTTQQVIEDLEPYLVETTIPRMVEAITPYLAEKTAPELIEALMPLIETDVAPRVVEAVMPMIETDIAPRIIDAVMPKIRAEIVPAILDDIVDDPKVRELIREQSHGLFLDAYEAIRQTLANGDLVVESAARRVLRRPVRVGADLVHAGLATRAVALVFDLTVSGWLIAQGLAAFVSLLNSIFNPVPPTITASLALLSINFVPLYLAVAWTLFGCSLGSWLVGVRICTASGANLPPLRAAGRAWLLVLGVLFWVLTAGIAFFDRRRRTLLDLLVHTEERYVAHERSALPPPLDQPPSQEKM